MDVEILAFECETETDVVCTPPFVNELFETPDVFLGINRAMLLMFVAAFIVIALLYFAFRKRPVVPTKFGAAVEGLVLAALLFGAIPRLGAALRHLRQEAYVVYTMAFITVFVSRFDFGSANLLIAMLIASVKASLVIAIFMHVKWDTAINKIVFLSSFLFLALLLIFTLSDQATRGRANPTNKIKAPVDNQFVHPSLRESNQ